MPSGPKRRRAARNKTNGHELVPKENVLLSVKIEEGLPVKIEPNTVALDEPVMTPRPGLDEPSMVVKPEPKKDVATKVEPVVEPSVECCTKSPDGVDVCDVSLLKENEGDKENNEIQKPSVVAEDHSVDEIKIESDNDEMVDSFLVSADSAEENGFVNKCSVDGGVELAMNAEFASDVKKTIEEQLHVIEQVADKLRQILANIN